MGNGAHADRGLILRPHRPDLVARCPLPPPADDDRSHGLIPPPVATAGRAERAWPAAERLRLRGLAAASGGLPGPVDERHAATVRVSTEAATDDHDVEGLVHACMPGPGIESVQCNAAADD